MRHQQQQQLKQDVKHHRRWCCDEVKNGLGAKKNYEIDQRLKLPLSR